MCYWEDGLTDGTWTTLYGSDRPQKPAGHENKEANELFCRPNLILHCLITSNLMLCSVQSNGQSERLKQQQEPSLYCLVSQTCPIFCTVISCFIFTYSFQTQLVWLVPLLVYQCLSAFQPALLPDLDWPQNSTIQCLWRMPDKMNVKHSPKSVGFVSWGSFISNSSD